MCVVSLGVGGDLSEMRKEERRKLISRWDEKLPIV